MAVAVVILAVLLAVVVYVCIVLVKELHWLREDLQTTADVEHTKCMAAVMKFVGDEWAAQVLEVAASDYASAEAHHNLDRISRTVYKPGGPPVPAIWLRERADLLRIMAGPDFAAAAEHAAGIDFNEVAL